MAHKPKRNPVKPIKPVVGVKKVVLPPDAVLHVEVPRGVAPVVAVHPTKNIVQIVPVPKEKTLTWKQWFLGE